MWKRPKLMRLGLVVTIAVLLLTAMSGLDGAIGEMHVPGAASHTSTSIMNPGWPWGEDPTLSEAFTVWQTWVLEEWEHGWPTPRWFVQLWLGLDLVFAVLLAALLARWRSWIVDAPPFLDSDGLENLTSSVGSRERVMGAWNAVLLTGPLISLYLLSDLAENLVTAGAVAAWPDMSNEISGSLSAQANVIQALSVVKMASLGFVVIPALLATLLLRQSRVSVPGAWIVLRTQVIASAVFGVLFLRTDQVGDVIYVWSARPGQAIMAFLATVLASFTIVVSGVWLSSRDTRAPGGPIKPLKWVTGGLGLGAVAFLFLILLGDASSAALVLPGAIVAFGLLSIPAFVASAGSAEGPPPLDFSGVGRGLRWLALVPLVAVALATVRVMPNAFFVGEEWVQFQRPLWVFVVLLIGVTALWVVRTDDATLRPGHVRDPASLLYLAVVLTGFGVWFVLANDQVGTLAVTAMFSSAACLALIPVGLVRLRPARGPIRVLGFRRVPAFLLLLVWAVLAANFDSAGGFHDARLTDREVEETDAIALEDAWSDWLTDNVTSVDPTEGNKNRVTVPLVFVASSGGASRSAYWTSLALDCLFTEHPTSCDRIGEPLPLSSVFVASGISGGSVGLATWHSSIPDDGGAIDLEENWYDELYGNDLLAPTLANLLFVDFPNAWIRMNGPDDRAATLERHLEAAADDAFSEIGLLGRGLYETSRVDDGGVRWPILILNGASVEDGCRMVGSAMRLVDTRSMEAMHREDVRPDECRTPSDVIAGTTESLAGSRAILDFSCTQDGERVDISLSTAAVLSARFPFVTPSGALYNCHDLRDRTFVVDGGTIDSSAAGPVVELLTRMQPTIDQFNSTQSDVCVTPVLIQIDNGYLDVSAAEPAKRPAESMAPLQGLIAAVGARADTTRQAAAIAFSAPPFTRADDQGYCPNTKRIVRYVQLVPTAHPGIESPMGWTLSEQSRQDLKKEFRNPTNTGCITVIESWFGGPNRDGEEDCGGAHLETGE
jgi:hypothetical protein